MEKKTGKYVCGGHYFATPDGAIAYANAVFKKNGIVLGVEAVATAWGQMGPEWKNAYAGA